MRLAFYVHGIPGAQGSKVNYGKGRMVESSKRVKPWRADVVNAARNTVDPDWKPLTGPVWVSFSFTFPRPKSHYGTGKNSDKLKPSAPTFVTSRQWGDADKLVRSSADALVTAGLIADDSLIVSLLASKTYAVDREPPGAYIQIQELNQ